MAIRPNLVSRLLYGNFIINFILYDEKFFQCETSFKYAHQKIFIPISPFEIIATKKVLQVNPTIAATRKEPEATTISVI